MLAAGSLLEVTASAERNESIRRCQLSLEGLQSKTAAWISSTCGLHVDASRTAALEDKILASMSPVNFHLPACGRR